MKNATVYDPIKTRAYLYGGTRCHQYCGGWEIENGMARQPPVLLLCTECLALNQDNPVTVEAVEQLPEIALLLTMKHGEQAAWEAIAARQKAWTENHPAPYPSPAADGLSGRGASAPEDSECGSCGHPRSHHGPKCLHQCLCREFEA